MRLVLTRADGLNAASCDRLLSRLAEERAQRAPEITIDLGQAIFVDPYGAACLLLICRQATDRGQRLVCVLPTDRLAQSMAIALGLVNALRPLAELRNVLPAGHASDRDTALALSPIRSRSDVQTVLHYLVDRSRGRLGYATGDVLDATKVVSELCFNVVDHSRAEGHAVARIYRDRKGRRFVSLAVVDPGIGIRTSLSQRYHEAAAWSHAEAIARALGGLSSRPQGGGAGLRSIHAVVQRYGGRISIRSGDTRLYLAAEHQPYHASGASFPGTQVGISFSQID
jgi:anti-anti-sigma regulatory factor/anti-sigma regulatory factor (Ser/Thr protein kinase)